MKFSCVCGAIIYDNTDYQENKAYFMPDQSRETAFFEVEAMKEPWIVLPKYERTMYQCRGCARIWLEDHELNLVCFKPEPESVFGILKRG